MPYVNECPHNYRMSNMCVSVCVSCDDDPKCCVSVGISCYWSCDIISGRLYFTSETNFPTDICYIPWNSQCVCVCVWKRERERVCVCIRLPSWEHWLSICLCVGSKIVNLHCQKLVLASPRSLKSVCYSLCVYMCMCVLGGKSVVFLRIMFNSWNESVFCASDGGQSPP